MNGSVLGREGGLQAFRMVHGLFMSSPYVVPDNHRAKDSTYYLRICLVCHYFPMLLFTSTFHREVYGVLETIVDHVL